jgi:FKBP-type peptidyl-prolyl cis-trans isomerase SlpA
MSETMIGPGTTVTLHFALKLEDGAVIDSTFDKQPATFEVGDGQLLPGFEQALFGLKAGDQPTLRISPEQGFGMPNPNNVQTIDRDRFSAEMTLEPGVMISFADAKGSELPGMVQSVTENQVSVDFNHPLAGRTLYFDVEIRAVADTEAMAIKTVG